MRWGEGWPATERVGGRWLVWRSTDSQKWLDYVDFGGWSGSKADLEHVRVDVP